jgi:hypothetical protein
MILNSIDTKNETANDEKIPNEPIEIRIVGRMIFVTPKIIFFERTTPEDRKAINTLSIIGFNDMNTIETIKIEVYKKFSLIKSNFSEKFSIPIKYIVDIRMDAETTIKKLNEILAFLLFDFGKNLINPFCRPSTLRLAINVEMEIIVVASPTSFVE